MEQPISTRFDSYFARSRFLLSLLLPPPLFFCPRAAKTRSGDEIKMASLNPIFTAEVSLRSLYLELTNESRRKREKQAWYIKTLGVVYLSCCLQVCELACMEFNSVWTVISALDQRMDCHLILMSFKQWKDVLRKIRHWMISDRLLLNDDKTEFLLIGTRQQLNKVESLPLSWNNK